MFLNGADVQLQTRFLGIATQRSSTNHTRYSLLGVNIAFQPNKAKKQEKNIFFQNDSVLWREVALQCQKTKTNVKLNAVNE